MTSGPSLAAALERAAAEDADGTAIVDASVRWSWADLRQGAAGVASVLERVGYGDGRRVGVLMRGSGQAIAVVHGIARVGAVAAMLPADLTTTELTAAVATMGVGLLVHDREHAAQARQLSIDTIELDRVRRGDATYVRDAPALDAAAVIVLTSGTTGASRAALLSHGALAASATAWLTALPPATGWLLAVGLGHVAGLGVIWRSSMARTPVVVAPGSDPVAILAALRDDPRPSHASLVPTMLARLLELPDGAPPATLRAVPLGGGPIDPALVERALDAGWPVVPTYGLTEAGSGVTALPTEEAATHPSSAGRPLPGVRVRIDDPDPDGIGDIVVDTPARFSGYLGDPDATAAAWTTDGWLRTGDLGRLDSDGRLTVIDRRLDRIVRGGENVSPAEVEAVLRSHPAIADAAVVARPDPVYGQVPVAVVVLRPGAPDPTDEALATHCRDQLARFKVPVAFDRRATLPRTATGKLRRGDLRDAQTAGRS